MANGTVTFFLDGSELSNGVTDEHGQVVLAIDTLAPGQHTMTAKFAGDTGFAGSESIAASVRVVAPTTVTLTAPTSAVLGEPVTLSASVAIASGVPTGTVEFREGATVLGSGDLDESGTAQFTTSSLPRGVHALTAAYLGADASAASTSEPATLLVKAPTTVTLATSVAPGELTLTATVAAADEPATGEVEFFNGETSLGTAALDAQGTATLKVPTTAAGTYSVTARYAGPESFVESTSEAKSVDVQAPAPGTSNPVTEETKKGCGCSSDPSGAMLLSLLGLAALRRRRVS
jgi:MYXO-CTERM domain-containing protein